MKHAISAYLSWPPLQVRKWRFSAKNLLVPLIAAAGFLQACTEPKRIVTALQPPSERLQCAPAGDRPTIPAEHLIDWSRVTTVPQARSEHDAYVRSIRTREGVIAGYIISVEGKLFACSSNAKWLRDWFAATAAPAG